MKLQCTREQLTGSDDTPILGFQLHGDALAAHALLQAMREASDGSDPVPFYSDDDYQEWIFDRADELLREWNS